MEIINRRQRMFSISRKLRREEKTVGFVPTMGALHEGHLSLVREARARCDIVIVSIFVNPAQFNDPGDLERYPRDLTADAATLAEVGVDYIFAPDAEEIYPSGFSTYVNIEGVADTLEGASRPGHFRGVATVVTILLNTVRPNLAFFGQKDAQQVAVVRRLVTDLGFETEVVVMPTVREESGLALSSRNSLLSPDDREKATAIINALRDAKTEFKKGQRNAAELTKIVEDRLTSDAVTRVDYVTVVNPETLETIEKIGDEETLILAAVYVGDIRLIDNVILNRKQ
jgi:pantoate--beta-alanine ligase